MHPRLHTSTRSSTLASLGQSHSSGARKGAVLSRSASSWSCNASCLDVTARRATLAEPKSMSTAFIPPRCEASSITDSNSTLPGLTS